MQAKYKSLNYLLLKIKEYLRKRISKSSIAKILEVSRTCLYSFIENRKLNIDQRILGTWGGAIF